MPLKKKKMREKLAAIVSLYEKKKQADEVKVQVSV